MPFPKIKITSTCARQFVNNYFHRFHIPNFSSVEECGASPFVGFEEVIVCHFTYLSSLRFFFSLQFSDHLHTGF
jgi:hypothetical protein